MADFQFKQFSIMQDMCGMKVGTDGVLLGAWASGGNRILDVGTGTGLIALMMAQRFPMAHVDAIDIDGDACRQALENSISSPFANRICIHHTSLQNYSSTELYDAIVSNPPFFVGSLKNPDKKRSMARHTDTLPFVDLFAGAKHLLAPGGILSLIVPVEVLEQIEEQAVYKGFVLSRRCGVKTVERKSPKRYLLAFSKSRTGEFEDSLEVLMKQGQNRSEWYAELTKDFYIK